ncbi:arylsulfatase B-like [Saccoglossus kowalevskii]|uniref:Arylsulfatase B-like n=1 Tax=Saccoglossus kowalevskii TaxID=10224 RepID=A0ABM0GT41_SACKO|nr:PREDICTED: arylsulfatase B-like [Saccoglossus kowalevskii]
MHLTYLALLFMTVFEVVLSTRESREDRRKPPHIVLILADDLGWNDVGWHNPEVKMPVLNQLAADGVIFNQAYVQPTCTPTRAALMSGYYPFKTGNQHQLLLNLHPGGLPLRFKTLPQRLKDVGYLTHIVGKWHLGFCKEAFLPTNRGFDSFYGGLTLGTSHFSKMNGILSTPGYDFYDNSGVVPQTNDYLAFMLADRAVKIINGHYQEYPLFMYFSMDVPAKSPEVPPEYEALYANITDDRTRRFYGKLSVMDDAVGSVVDALKKRDMWDDTLLIFIGDNGALASSSGSNWPLRGIAATLFEGATRVPAFIHGNMLKQTGYENNELWHIVDLHKTILSLAGAESSCEIDGMDMWDTFSKNESSPRNEIVYNIDDDPISPGAAIRVGDYKLIAGNPDLFYPLRLINQSDGWFNYGDVPTSGLPVLPTGDEPPPPNVTYLFNVIDDPEERNNIADDHPEIVQALRQRLDEHRIYYMPAVNQVFDEAGDPSNFDGVFSPGWC